MVSHHHRNFPQQPIGTNTETHSRERCLGTLSPTWEISINPPRRAQEISQKRKEKSARASEEEMEDLKNTRLSKVAPSKRMWMLRPRWHAWSRCGSVPGPPYTHGSCQFTVLIPEWRNKWVSDSWAFSWGSFPSVCLSWTSCDFFVLCHYILFLLYIIIIPNKSVLFLFSLMRDRKGINPDRWGGRRKLWVAKGGKP